MVSSNSLRSPGGIAGMAGKVRRRVGMKKNSIVLFAAVALVALALAACSPAASLGAAGANAGSIAISVSPFNPMVQQAYAESHKLVAGAKALGSRAFMSAGRVDFTVEDSTTYATIDSWTVYPNTTQQMGTSANLGSRTIPAGSYILYAYVYNSSGDPSYIVSGSKAFVVAAGQSAASNVVTVTCLPVSYVYLSSGYASASTTLSTAWTFNANSGLPVTAGSETWYSAYVSTANTSFSATPDHTDSTGAAPYLFVFDSSGLAVPGAMASATQGGVAHVDNVATTANSYYYICVIDASTAAAATRSFTVKYSPYVPAPTTTPLTPISSTNIAAQPAAWTSGSIAVNTTPVWYAISSTPGANYTIWWNDSYSGSVNVTNGAHDYSLDVKVSAYHSDYTTPYFTQIDSGYTIYQDQAITAADSTIYIKVEPYYSGASYVGTFGIAVQTPSTVTYTFGNSADTGLNGTGWSNYFQGPRYYVSAGSSLVKFGLISRQTGTHAVMALYSDNAGVPGSLVATSPSTLLSAGVNEFAPTGTTVAISPGWYWIMANFDANTSIGAGNANLTDQYYSSYGTAPQNPFPFASRY
jgi:hypothetical protein